MCYNYKKRNIELYQTPFCPKIIFYLAHCYNNIYNKQRNNQQHHDG